MASPTLTVTVRGPDRAMDTSFAGSTVVTPGGHGEGYARAAAAQANG